jgi:hypothetical protein
MAELLVKIDENTGEVAIIDSTTSEPVKIDLEREGVQVDAKSGTFIDRSGAVVSIDYDSKSGTFTIRSLDPGTGDGETKPPGENPNPENPNPPVNSVVDANADFLKKNKIAPVFQNVSIQRGGNNAPINATNAFNRAAAIVGQKGNGAKTNSIFDPNAKKQRK